MCGVEDAATCPRKRGTWHPNEHGVQRKTMQAFLDKANQLLNSVGGSALGWIFPLALGIVIVWIIWRLTRRRKRPAMTLPADLSINVAELGEQGPAEGMPTLEFYNLPVRLAAIVVAPAGLGRDLPPDDQLAPLLEALLPGLDKVAERDRPVVRRWPNQVSASGFAHLFFINAKLPGTGGKGTPWSSAAGSFKYLGRPVMAGLVLRAAKPNSLGQTIIEAEHQWLGCLRVRWS
jgi:hypothetical protein